MSTSSSSNRTLFIAVAAVVAAATAWIMVLKPRGGVNGQYFYDLGANELYVESVDALPPVTRPSGAEGVLAVVMACNSCDDNADRFIAYLEKHTPEYNQVIASGEPPTAQQMQAKSLIRAVDDDTWLPANHRDAQKIINAGTDRCAPRNPVYCTP